MESIDLLPLWAFFIFVVVMSLICVEAGYLQGKRLREKSSGESDASVGAMVGGVLALLAFILSFTFGMAAGRFDERRHLVLEEANAIGTTYLRTEFLDEPAKTKAQELLRKYVIVRVKGVSEQSQLQASIDESEALQAQLWKFAVDLGRKHPTPVSALFISSLNQVIDLHAMRVTTGLHTRVPKFVWAGLLVISALCMAGVGYFSGRCGTRAIAETIILAFSFGTVLLMVADLDRPGEGLLRINQQPMIDLARQIGAQ
jgi:hypothetical protein